MEDGAIRSYAVACLKFAIKDGSVGFLFDMGVAKLMAALQGLEQT